MKQRYPWPASQLNPNDMELLYQKRKTNGKPITLLIKEAVQSQYGNDADEK